MQQLAELAGAEIGDESTSRFGDMVAGVVLPLLVCFFGLLYPILMIPTYRSLNPGGRLLYCVAIHPVLMELLLMLMRAGRVVSNADAAKQPFNYQFLSCVIESMLVFARRCMMQSIGDKRLTIIAIVVTAVEEALLRATLVQRDLWFRRVRGQRSLTDAEQKVANIVEMAAINNSMLIELNAIFLARFMFVILEQDKYVVDLGYSVNGNEAAAGVLLVNLFLEVFGECAVDYVALWSEAQEGIPVHQYFEYLNKWSMVGFHAANTCATLGWAVWTFATVPTAMLCDSATDPCSCLPGAFPMYEPLCDAQNATNYTTTAIETPVDDCRGVLVMLGFADCGNDGESGDIIFVIISVVVIIAMVAVFAASSAWRKQRQTAKIVAEKADRLAEKDNELDRAVGENAALKRLIAEAQRKMNEVLHSEGGTVLEELVTKVPHSDIEFGESVGEGSFGTVFKAEWNKQIVAVKTMRTTKINKPSLEHFKSEIVVMAPLHHPNLVNLLGACWTDGPDKLCIVLEFCEGSVADLLKDRAYVV